MALLKQRPMSIGSIGSCEYLQNLSISATEEFENAATENKKLKFKLDSEGPSLYPEEFAKLKAQVEQSDIRTAKLQVVARQRQKDLDELRAKDKAEIDRVEAKEDYDATVRQFERISKTLIDQTKQLQELKSSFDFGTETRNRLLREIAEKRNLMRDLGISI